MIDSHKDYASEDVIMRRVWLIIAGVIILTSSAALSAAAADGDEPAPAAQAGDLHPIFAPDEDDVAAAAELGQQFRKRKKAIKELNALWSRRVPDADGRAVCLVPAARVAMAAYEAEKLHKDKQGTERVIEDALREGQDHIIFQVTLRSKGSVSWIWPRDAKPGDRKSLETVAFTLADDRGKHYQPLDPEAARKIVAKSVRMGLPVPLTTYRRLGSHWWVSIPLFGPKRRQDFEATYTVVFPLKDQKGRPLFTEDTKSITLNVIGARAEKNVVFSLADLTKVPKKRKR